MKRKIVCFLILVSVFSIHLRRQLFVSTKGNDANEGSLESPFRTIERAINASLSKRGEHVIISLREGTYYLDKPVRLEAGNFLPASLQIEGYKEERAVISAGKRLDLKWKSFRNGIYVAKLPAGISFERLYVNQHSEPLARYPNYDTAARVFHGTASDAIAPARVKRWKNPVGGYVHALHKNEWGGFHYRITGVNANGDLQLEGGWQNNRPNEMHKEHRFVENIFEELDAPGEWYLNRAEQKLYYYPRKGVSLDNAVIEISRLKNSFELIGTAEKPLQNIRLNNLVFAHNERSFMDTREPLLRSDWTIYRGGAILLDGTENCKISNCVFEGIGGNAIMVSNYNKKDTITGCHVYNIGSNAVCFIGNTRAVRSPVYGYSNYIPYGQMDKTAGPLTNDYPQQCVVTDNLFHDLGDIEKQATGVQIQVAAFITVSHNSIYNTSRAGINIGDGCFGGHLLEYNDVFNTVRETGDHGSFNSWGRDRFWGSPRSYMDSLVAIHPELILLDPQHQTVIRNNRFRCDHGWDIDLDDGSSNYHIYNNLCLNGGIKLREGFYRIVENNIMVNNSFHPHVWFKNSGDVFRHNIVMKKYAPSPRDLKNWGMTIENNLFPDTASLFEAQLNGTDRSSIVGDPLFVDPRKGDYTVAPGSPAFSIGFTNFPMDKFGVKRPTLKKVTLQPQIPVLINDVGMTDKTTPLSFLGGTLKSVNGPGDRSVYGLPDETGVIVISAGRGLLAKSGLKDGDVIRNSENIPVTELKQFIDLYQSDNWKGKIPLTIIRDQQSLNITLLTR